MFSSATGRQVKPSGKYEGIEDEKEREKFCAVCGVKGTKIFQTTMLNHLDVSHWKKIDDSFRFSGNPDCDVIYFSNRVGLYFFQDEVKTVYGPKGGDGERPVCYCLGVTKEMIRHEIVDKKCCDSLKDIEAYTKAGTGKWCFVTNPSGRCCREYLPSIVDEYLNELKSATPGKELGSIAADLEMTVPKQHQVKLRVEGMTCSSCAVTVKAALESIGGSAVQVSVSQNSAVALLPAEVTDKEAEEAVTDAGYPSSLTEVKEDAR